MADFIEKFLVGNGVQTVVAFLLGSERTLEGPWGMVGGIANEGMVGPSGSPLPAILLI
jgi:hypothetical protein